MNTTDKTQTASAPETRIYATHKGERVEVIGQDSNDTSRALILSARGITSYVPKSELETAAQGQNVRRDIVLNSGRIVRHERMNNGAQHAFIANSATGEMTEAEWTERKMNVYVKANMEKTDKAENESVDYCECCGKAMRSSLPHCVKCHRELWEDRSDSIKYDHACGYRD